MLTTLLSSGLNSSCPIGRRESASVESNELIVNTGAPQGCVLSPILFAVCTNVVVSTNALLTLVKFADDITLVARLRDENSLAENFLHLDLLNSWFRESFLDLNISKTKELVFDSRKEKEPFIPVTIDQQSVEVVSSIKYLGTFVDSKLSFNDNVVSAYKKAEQRLYLLRKLRSLGVGRHVLEPYVYRCLVESVLSFSTVTWYGNLSVKNRPRLARVVNTASRIIGVEQKQLCALYHLSVCRKSLSILHDKTHFLNICFQHLPSGRRLKVPLAENVYKKSFIPTGMTPFSFKCKVLEF